MANSFDPKGALVGGIAIVVIMALAFLLVLPMSTVHVRIDLPPAKAAPR